MARRSDQISKEKKDVKAKSQNEVQKKRAVFYGALAVVIILAAAGTDTRNSKK